ncbi:MAG: sulfatase [Opitutaceae bacterium]|nr:sulfatase [Opitutaceae bacterium]
MTFFPVGPAVRLLFAIAGGIAASALTHAADQPNILWLTLEDMSPNLGCYGDSFARTPNIDAFARDAVRYTHAFAPAPVCSPARACLITGVYATSLGNPHLRCSIPIPAEFKGYAEHLRDAGYFTSNNAKTDYNLKDEQAFIKRAWSRNGANVHWRQRERGQPFMSVFNFSETHQSRSSAWPQQQFEREIRSKLPPADRADPARVPLPGFYPDTPLARQAMARYYDCIAAVDRRVGAALRELETDGLADDTIVFVYSDHGMGMPGGKRLLRDSGLHVPLLIRFPAKWRHLAPAAAGATVDRLVSFVDFAPTLLSLAGIPIPRHMQGTAFLGPGSGPEREFVFAARDRVDEAIDTARSVRDRRWLYIRNYRPHLSWAPPEGYSDASPFRRELLELARTGRAGTGATAWLAATRATEELYDTVADPQQLNNLAGDARHRATLERLRTRLQEWLAEVRDIAFLPEPDALSRSGALTPYEMARRPGVYPFERVLAAAERVGAADAAGAQRKALGDGDPAVRYWSAVGLRANPTAAKTARAELERALRDASASVAVEAAGALLAMEPHPAALSRLEADLNSADTTVVVHAARTLELLGTRAQPLAEKVRARAKQAVANDERDYRELFVRFALEGLLETLDTKHAP